MTTFAAFSTSLDSASCDNRGGAIFLVRALERIRRTGAALVRLEDAICLAVQLRHRNHRHADLLRQHFQRPRDVGNLTSAVVIPAPIAAEQLEIIDDQEIEPAGLRLQRPGTVGAGSRARAGNEDGVPNELLEVPRDVERVERRAATATGGGDSRLAPVGTIHRPEDCSGEARSARKAYRGAQRPRFRELVRAMNQRGDARTRRWTAFALAPDRWAECVRLGEIIARREPAPKLRRRF